MHTLGISEKMFSKSHSTLEFIHQMVDHGYADNILQGDDNAADGLCGALATLVKVNTSIEGVRLECLPVNAVRGVRRDFSQLMKSFGQPYFPVPPGIESTISGVNAEQRRSEWARMARDLKERGVGVVRDTVITQLVKVVGGATYIGGS